MIAHSASDLELLARQASLQAEAAELLAGLDLAALVADIGPLLLAGSVVSGLMGLDIYTAVLDAGVATPAEFAAWLARRDTG